MDQVNKTFVLEEKVWYGKQEIVHLISQSSLEAARNLAMDSGHIPSIKQVIEKTFTDNLTKLTHSIV